MRLKQAVIAGARRVILMQERLNRMNVFPVPDNDTGTNMALTLQSVAEGAISCHDASISEMSRRLADSALMGARGNSGAILAQFFQGFSEKLRNEQRISLVQFGAVAQQARNSSYEAITEPQEGTILTVIHDWAEHARSYCHHAHDFIDLISQGLRAAQSSLNDTPKKLKMLAKAGVVDAGAQGFVHMLEGILNFVLTGKIEQAVGIGASSDSGAKVEAMPQDILFQYCTECFIEGERIARVQLRDELRQIGNSLIVAGSTEKMRVHVHTNEPETVFEIAGRYGQVSRRKFDDMRKQHTDAHAAERTSSIALVTDSSCDLEPEFIIRHNIQTVPVQLSFGQQNYIDKITITPKEYYRMLTESGYYPKTSQPTPGDFANTYEQLWGHYDQAVSIHLSGVLSGTLQAARTAAKGVPDGKLRVLDGRNVCIGLGLLVAEAARAIEQGCDLDEVVSKVEAAANKIRFYVAIDTVEYLIRGGRLSRSRGIVARGLNLKPILRLTQDGQVEVAARVLGAQASLKKVMKFIRKEARGKKNLRFAVAHANAIEKAAWLRDQIEKQCEVRDIITVNVSPALGAHAGPGAAGVAFLGD